MSSSHVPSLPPPFPGAPSRPPERRPPLRLTAPHPLVGRAILQVALVWRGQIIGYRLLDRRRKISLGPSKRTTFVTPAVGGGRRRFVLLVPKRDGYILRLTPSFDGDLHVGGSVVTVADVLGEPATGRHRGKGEVREVTLATGDRAKLAFAQTPDLRVEIRWVDAPEYIPRPKTQDPTIWKIALGTSIALGAMALILTLAWQKAPPKSLALTSERLAKIEAPVLEIKKEAARREKEAEAKKQEEGQMKRAKEKAGRLGRADAKQKETVIPKGREDILREKVSKIGLLGLIGKEKPQGSGLSKLFAATNDVEQAVAGMQGAKLVAGRGAGGLSTSGAGTGGGGTGYGHIYGAGNLDTGGRGTKGRGRGPKLAERGEKEVGVGIGKGNGEMDGSLTRDQVLKVVMAHKAGVNYCYEKELQHKQHLSGTIEFFWVIQPDGVVQKASIKTSNLSDAAVEGCILRQIKQWQFPKAAGQTVVGRFPFLFKGGT
jgi:hypothetical protein